MLPPAEKSAKPSATPVEHKGLVSHNGSLINVGSLLQRAEQQDSGRLYLENKIHTLELKLGEQLALTGTWPKELRSGGAAALRLGCLPPAPVLDSQAVILLFYPQRRATTASQPLK